jgi:hypothetical protein
MVANAIASKRKNRVKKTAVELATCLIQCLFAASFTRLCRSHSTGGKAWERLSRKPHTGRWEEASSGKFQIAREIRERYGSPGILWRNDLDEEGGRRSARSGTAEHAGSYSVRNPLPLDIGDGKTEAGAGGKIRGDGNRGDGPKALTKRASGLAQRGCDVRGGFGC